MDPVGGNKGFWAKDSELKGSDPVNFKLTKEALTPIAREIPSIRRWTWRILEGAGDFFKQMYGYDVAGEEAEELHAYKIPQTGESAFSLKEAEEILEWKKGQKLDRSFHIPKASYFAPSHAVTYCQPVNKLLVHLNDYLAVSIEESPEFFLISEESIGNEEEIGPAKFSGPLARSKPLYFYQPSTVSQELLFAKELFKTKKMKPEEFGSLLYQLFVSHKGFSSQKTVDQLLNAPGRTVIDSLIAHLISGRIQEEQVETVVNRAIRQLTPIDLNPPRFNLIETSVKPADRGSLTFSEGVAGRIDPKKLARQLEAITILSDQGLLPLLQKEMIELTVDSIQKVAEKPETYLKSASSVYIRKGTAGPYTLYLQKDGSEYSLFLITRTLVGRGAAKRVKAAIAIPLNEGGVPTLFASAAMQGDLSKVKGELDQIGKAFSLPKVINFTYTSGKGKTKTKFFMPYASENALAMRMLQPDWFANSQGALSLRRNFAIGSLELVSRMHECNIVSNDVKPLNILLDISQNALTLVISDLGLSTTRDAVPLGGTFGFIAPERIGEPDAEKLAKICAEKCEIFALGITLYKALYGSFPADYWEQTVRKEYVPMYMGFANKIPLEKLEGPLDNLLKRMISSNPEERPSAREAADKLKSLEEAAFRFPVELTSNSSRNDHFGLLKAI